MSGLAVMQFVLLMAAMCAAGVALATAVVYPRLRPLLAQLPPARRARYIVVLAAAPFAAAAIHALACFAPLLEGASLPACCVAHVPSAVASPIGWVLVGLAVAVVVGPLVREMLRARRSRFLVSRLLEAASHSDQLGVGILDTEMPVALATGPGGSVVLSQTLVRDLDPELLDAVIAHERAHLLRRDPRRRFLASLLTCAHLPGTRARLLRDLTLASEQACDEDAADKVGDRLLVARALLAVERLFGRTSDVGLMASALGSCHVVERVEALLAPRPLDCSPMPERLSLAGTLIALLALNHPIHHATEHLLELLIR